MRMRTGEVLPRKFLKGDGTSVLRTNKPHRSIDPEPVARFLPIFLSLSLFFLTKFYSRDGASTKPKVIAREKNTMQ